MKRAQIIYDTNRQAINFLLTQKGYKPTFNGLMDAVEDLGDTFLVELYNEVSSSFDQADGNFWAKFKNIFHSASDIVEKTGKISGGVDDFINPTLNNTTDPAPTPEKKVWKPNLMLWGGAAAGIILILVLIYIFRK